MRKSLTHAALGVIAGGALAVSSAGSAYAATGSPAYSRDQVGYSATGASFKEVEEHFKLPRAGRYASELGWLGMSVQLWSPHVMAELTAFACTDQTCLPGGSAFTGKYRLNFSLYNPGTHALICSTSATASSQRCQVQGLAAWNRTRIAAGTTVNLDLYFGSDGILSADVQGPGGLFASVLITPDVTRFNQARIVAQFASSPFAAAPFRRPATRQLLMTVGGFSYEADFILGDGRTCYIGSALVTHHRVIMTRTGTGSAGHEISPGGLTADGTTFNIYMLA